MLDTLDATPSGTPSAPSYTAFITSLQSSKSGKSVPMQSVVHDPAHSPPDPSPLGTQHAALSCPTREENPEKGHAEVNPAFVSSCALTKFTFMHIWPRAAASASGWKAIINILECLRSLRSADVAFDGCPAHTRSSRTCTLRCRRRGGHPTRGGWLRSRLRPSLEDLCVYTVEEIVKDTHMLSSSQNTSNKMEHSPLLHFSCEFRRRYYYEPCYCKKIRWIEDKCCT